MLDFNVETSRSTEYLEKFLGGKDEYDGKEIVDGHSPVDYKILSSALPSEDECRLFSEFEQKLTIEKVLGNFIFPKELLESK